MSWSAPDAIPGDLLVETRIAGAEEDWIPAGARTERDFTGLGDGYYVFEVRAVDALGRPGPVASRAFTVLPPWYRTPAAISGFCFTALAIGWISWLMRLRVARRRAEELEGLVDTRTRELARVNAEMTRFIARMNHEIRNPLNGLLGAVGILEQFKHSEREGRMVQILRACADHLGAVVEDVLDFSNIEGGRIVVQDRTFSVAEMLEAVPRMMLGESERTGTEVVTTISPGVPPVVVADPDRIRQILVNFLGNALKFAPGEPVHIDVTTALVDESPWLRFAVRDHGPGISESDKQSLFQMFERGKNPSKRKVRGMGIGLATCRLLARRMGGEVGVISGLGEGSEFFLRLPLKVEAGVIPVPETQPLAELHKLACLIVEDQEFNRVILKDMLERLGCSVDEAADAETALSLAAMNRYEIVFTDLELPDAAPGEILKMLKEQHSTAKAPVPALVVTTAYATENVRQTCLGAGATAFLAKPLSASKVLAVVREIDSARRPAPSVVAPAQEPAQVAATGVIFHLARIRGCGVDSVAAEIAGNIDEEVRKMHASVHSTNSREVAQQAHRLLSLAALADAPELAAVAAGIQNDAREGRLPAANRLAALVAGMAAAKETLGAINSGGSAGARSRGQGRNESAASSHSD
ncbi:MAG TPA: ATP-binding protein [Opitutaceae bacterium]